MMTADTRAKLDLILPTGNLLIERRILTVDLVWPTTGGAILEPPFPAGSYLQVPAVGTPAVYDAATFDPAVWTDVSALVSDYRVTAAANSQLAQVLISVPATWADTDMDAVFREMRAVLIQERYTGHSAAGAAQVTSWENRAFVLSDGYTEVWDDIHRYEVLARDVLKLAHLTPLGGTDGAAVYQADIIQEGTYASPITLTYKGETADAYEYYVPSRGGFQQPNWADRPPPLLWVTNAKDAAANVRLAVAGNAVQAVFGEGVLRIDKAFSHADPGADLDYTLGLGIVAPAVPNIVGIVYRFAHPTMDGWDAEADIADALTVAVSAAGWIEVTGDYSAYPDGLTLILLDGTGLRYQTEAITYDAGSGRSLITLHDAAVVIAVSTAVQYGEANRARDLFRRWLLECGFQVEDSGGPFYLNTPEQPHLAGVDRDIILPPLVYQDADTLTVVDAMEDLRRRGYLPPNYVALATRAGNVEVKPVEQLADGSPSILSMTVLLPPASIQRSDGERVTRVVTRGLRRQVVDAMRDPAYPTVAEVTGADGLPAPGMALTENDYLMDGAANNYQLLSQDRAQLFTNSYYRRLRGWAAHPTTQAQARALADQWGGAGLIDITLAATATIAALELDVSNSWALGFLAHTWSVQYADSGYYDDSRGYIMKYPWRNGPYAPSLELQSLAVLYEDPDTGAWEPLVSYIPSRWQFPDRIRVEARDFDTRAEVTTDRLRIICVQPSFMNTGSYDESWWYAAVGVFLSGLRVWSSEEIRGVAAIGETAPFDTAGWIADRVRLRTRTWVVPDAAPWAQTQADVNALALLWLQEHARDYAVRQLAGVRPDLDLWDTVRVTLPGGSATNYLVTGLQHVSDGQAAVSGVNYAAG